MAVKYGLGDESIYYLPMINFIQLNHEECETLGV